MSFDERAERLLKQAVEEAERGGYNARGGNMRFVLTPGPPISDVELRSLCNEWMEPVTPIPYGECGWRPRVDPEENTVIQLTSREALNCQGRAETVGGICVIAAAISKRIPPKVAMACPSASRFWDWAEKYRIVTRIERPLTALLIPADKLKASHAVPSVPSSRAVTEYTHVFMDEKWKADIAERNTLLAEVDLKYISPPLAEAERMIQSSYKFVMDGYPGNASLSADMEHPYTITTGSLLRYCKRIWHDSEVYHLGTRWRPAYMPNLRWSRNRKEIRGGMYVCDQYTKRTIAIDGSSSICQGLAPILAAIRIRLDPAIAKKTSVLGKFYDFMNSSSPDFHAEERCVSDLGTPDWKRRVDEGDQHGRFEHEERMMRSVMNYLLSEYSLKLGQWHGGNTLPHVKWSRNDFMDQCMRWWPNAVIQETGRFRYVPNRLEKGGLDWHDTGDYVGVQGRAAWQGALMPLTASLICGIPSEIAALLECADQFWNLVMVECGGNAIVHRERDRLRAIRDRRFGPEWDQKRASLIPQHEGKASDWSRREESHSWAKKGEWSSWRSRQDDWKWSHDQSAKQDGTDSEWNRETNHGSAQQDWNSKESSHANTEWNRGTYPSGVEWKRPQREYREDKVPEIMTLQSAIKLGAESLSLSNPMTAVEISRRLFDIGIGIAGAAAPSWSVVETPKECYCSVDGFVLEFSKQSGSGKYTTCGVGKDGGPENIVLAAVIACDTSIEEITSDPLCGGLLDVYVDKYLRNVPDVTAMFEEEALQNCQPSPVQLIPPKRISSQLMAEWETGTHYYVGTGWIKKEAGLCDRGLA